MMKTNDLHIEKLKFTALTAWFVLVLLLLMGYRLIIDIVVFVLTKLYEIFIQNQPVKI